VKALEATGVIPVMGHFKNKDRKCKKCGHSWIAHEEKETDVSIGVTLLNDAYKQLYDTAYLITRDSDLMPAVKTVLSEFATKKIIAVAPPMMGHSNDLIAICSSKQKITLQHVQECLFPEKVFYRDGTLAATRPPKYARK
jgi:uncharacterized LabA/DUF88 family protein